jgi:hypothetical protein
MPFQIFEEKMIYDTSISQVQMLQFISIRQRIFTCGRGDRRKIFEKYKYLQRNNTIQARNVEH